jgi:uncharacterized protein YuzE
LTLDKSGAVESEEVSPGIIVDANANNKVVGIKMPHLSGRTPEMDTLRLQFETLPAAAS